MKQVPERNSPCSCGSGKKYKKCCGQPGLAKHAITHVHSGSSLFSRVQNVASAASSVRSLKDRINSLNPSTPPKDGDNSLSSSEPPPPPKEIT